MSGLCRSAVGIICAHPSRSFLSFSPPLLIVSNQLYLLNMRPGLLRGRLGRPHCMQRSWSAPDKRPQLPNEKQLHHCLHVTDGWQCWQTGGINWQGYQGETGLHFRASLFSVRSASRCIFIQMWGKAEREERPGVHALLRWFNAKQRICLCRFPLYTQDRPLHNCTAVSSRLTDKKRLKLKWMMPADQLFRWRIYKLTYHTTFYCG